MAGGGHQCRPLPLVLVLVASCAAGHSLLPDAESWTVSCSRNCRGEDLCNNMCSGKQTQVHSCPAVEACPTALVQCPPGAKPVPCRFSEWSEWSSPLGCSGLCVRTRNMSAANRCGGEPCKGPLEESRRCPNPCRSELNTRDCALSPWSEWGRCGSIADFQKQRRRSVLSPARNGGHPCSGLLEETSVCGEGLLTPVHCKVSAWMEWTPCTLKCGGGERMRLRTILTKAKDGGLACHTSLSQVYPCSLQPCPQPDTVDCRLGPWHEWSDCLRGQQRMRHRSIEVEASGGGSSCEEALTETAGCVKEDDGPRSCVFGHWSEWKFCDRTCGGGQTFRKRQVLEPANPGGDPCEGDLLQTSVCNTHPCSLAKQPCRVSPWSDWSPCTTTCGAGQQLRRRRVLTEAQEGGLGCYLALAEARACPETGGGIEGLGRQECGVSDCAWADWSEWSACSVTCEGGERSRSRHVLHEASAGGKACEPSGTRQLERCGMGPCEVKDCVDGAWGPWGEWSSCSVSCGGGYRFHHRQVEREANDCGQPALGDSSQAEACNLDITCDGDVDCELSEWGDWSDCTSSCMGLRKRSRAVKQHRVGAGATCGSAFEGSPLEELESCVSKACLDTHDTGPVCALGDWEEWYTCPVTCGGGQTMRTRRVRAPTQRLLESYSGFLGEGKVDPLQAGDADKADEGCAGAVRMTKPCSTQSCGEPQDCAYADWSEWGACTRCDGLQFRQRGVLSAPANEGKECALESTNQTRPCAQGCKKKLQYCVWGTWTPWAPCSKSCGPGMTFRKRELNKTDVKPDSDPLALGSVDKDCSGKQIDVHECDDNPPCSGGCTPQDCVLSPWSEWSEPRCEGICERSRSIVTENNECGKPCSATLNTTKACEATCDSRDCKLSPWTTWTQCSSELDQRFHVREILQKPVFNGAGCIGPLNLTRSCATGEDAPNDCKVSTWMEWGECDKTCGGGQQARNRRVAANSQNGGAACDASLSETRPCSTQSCIMGVDELMPTDCQLGPWSLWSKCGGPGGKQSFRKRILMHEAAAGGMPCQGRLYETRPCSVLENSDHRNCIFSTWSMWSTCPKSCGGAQHARSRSIEAHAKGHGLQCDGPLLQDAPCGQTPCPDAQPTQCKLSDWGEWQACSATCGEGFAKRQRTIAQPAPLGTRGCQGALEEVEKCQLVACPDTVDCAWQPWQTWSDCVPAPDMCGVGFKRRRRDINTLPKAGGQLCKPQVMEEVSPVVNCKGQPQCCIDGAWDDWADWGACSATCGRGSKLRSRKLKVKETWCGKPASGPPMEFEGCESTNCNKDQDCIFSDWSEASPCSANCHGNRVRTRHIRVNATGEGKSCEGALDKTERCNPAEGQREPYSCEVKGRSAGPQDCVMTQWSEWSDCTATCDRGYRTRFRQVKVNPAKGGQSCPSATRELVSCHKGLTCFPDRSDCKWGEWTAWSDCSPSGRRVRSRGVATPPSNFGLGCEGPVREVASCEEEGGDTCEAAEHVCRWEQWTEWTACSATCGSGGVRRRSRHLEIQNGTEALLKFEAGKDAALPTMQGTPLGGRVASRRARELSLAFVLGSGCLTVVMLASWGTAAGLGWLRRRWELRALEYNAVPMHP